MSNLAASNVSTPAKPRWRLWLSPIAVAAVGLLAVSVALLNRSSSPVPADLGHATAQMSATGLASLPMAAKDQIDAYIQSRMQVANIPGLALGVVHGDQILYLKSYGIAGPDGRSVTPQTPFILGSTSKSFTALALMQLVEAGKIDLDDPVTQYLPWFHTADAAASAQITVRDLLNQDSGLPVYEGRRGFVDGDRSDTALENGVRQLAAVTLNHSAGQSYEYANENYTTLGQIIQAVSGQSYEDFIRSQIFAPLQMNHSAAALSDSMASDVASGYRYWLLWPVAFNAPYPRAMAPAGFLISSAEDMSHYLIAQLNGGTYNGKQVLSAQGIATLHAAGARSGGSSSYGMGWVVHGQSGALKIDHNGDTSNFHSNMLLLPDQQLGIVILINVSGLNNAVAINIPIEGVAAILQGNSLTPAVDPPIDLLTPALLLLPLVIAIVWVASSLVVVRRWQRRGELPVRGRQVVWRFVLPLAVDLCLAGVGWVILPAKFETPMATIRLFTPDVFLILVLLTALSLGLALARSMLVFRAAGATRFTVPPPDSIPASLHGT